MPTHGSANKKMKSYPNISKFIEAHYPQLYEIMDDSDSLYLIRRSRSGVTFLIPDDSTINEMKKILEGNDPEIVKDILQSMTIPMFLPNIETWKKYQNEIPSMMHKQIEIKDIKLNEVILKNNSKITLEKKFNLFKARRGKQPEMAVWCIKGKVDYGSAPDMDIFKVFKSMNNKPVEKVGGSELDENIVAKFVSDIEHKEYEYYTGIRKMSYKLTVLCNYAKCLKEHLNRNPMDEECKTNLILLANTFNPNKPGDVEANFYIHINACIIRTPREVRKSLVSPTFMAKSIGENAYKSKLTAPVIGNPIMELTQLLTPYKASGSNTDIVEVLYHDLNKLDYNTVLKQYTEIVEGYHDDNNSSTLKQFFRSDPGKLLHIHETKFCFSECYSNNLKSGKNYKNYNSFMNSISVRRYVALPGISLFSVNFDEKNKCISKFLNYIITILGVYGADEDESEDNESSIKGDDKMYVEVNDKISTECIQELKNYLDSTGKSRKEAFAEFADYILQESN